MADNIAITSGSGTTVSTEEVTTLNGSSVSARHLQRVAAAVATADGVAKDLLLGRNSDATSLSVALSTEDAALLTSLLTAPTGFATAANQTTELSSLASILAKLSADPSTETTLAAILAKIIAAPATSAKQDALAALIGEVQSSPTSNTLLDRLKSLQTALAATLTVSGTVTANIGTVATLATAAKQDTGNTSVASIDTKTPSLGQALAAASVPVILPSATITTLTPPSAITGFATETTLGGVLTTSDFDTKSGSLTETAPASDTASSGLNGRLQRIAQRLTSLITALGSPFQAGGSIGNTTFASTQSGTWNVTNVSGTVSLPTGAATAAKQPALGTAGTASTDVITVQGIASGTAQPVSAASLPLPSGAATETTLAAQSAKLPAALGQTTASASLAVTLATDGQFVSSTGSLTETAPASDTASSGLNGRLQRIAQRITTLLAVFPTTIDTNSGNKSASTLRVVLATDQPSLTNAQPVSQSGTWTVQPGNTANTTGWLVKETRSTTGTAANVTGSATSVTVLASNSSRLGATVFNDSSALLYLKLGATASTTSFTALLATNDYYEVPFQYTGIIDGIWSSATGSARVVELT